MDIKLKSCLEGAKEAEGVSVIIDVFRASNTIIACSGQGADFIIPVEDLNEAYKTKKQNPTYLLVGEREGIPAEGFDYGSSPVKLSRLNFTNKKIILTTSNCTRGISNARKSNEILIGSFANIKILAEYIKNRNPSRVSIVAIGWGKCNKSKEDELCALYLKDQLLGIKSDFEKIKLAILNSDSADFLRKINQEDDLEYCLKLNVKDILPRYDFESQKIINQKRPF